MRENFVVVGSLLLGLVGCGEGGHTGNEPLEEQVELTDARNDVAQTTHALNAVMTGVATLTLDLAPPQMASKPGGSLSAAMRARAQQIFGKSCSSGTPAIAEITGGFVVDFGDGCNCPRLGGMVSGSLSVEASLEGQLSSEAIIDLQNLTVNGHAVTGTVSLNLAAQAALAIDLSAQTSVGSLDVSGTATLGVGVAAGAGAGASAGAGAGVSIGVGVGVGTGNCSEQECECEDACEGTGVNAGVGIGVNAGVGVGVGVGVGELVFSGEVGVTVGGQASILAVTRLHFGAGSCYPDSGTITVNVEGHAVTAICDSATAITGELSISVDRGNPTVAMPPAGSCGASAVGPI